MALTSWSFEPKWYWTAELLPLPAAAPISRSETPSSPRAANRRSAAATICALAEGGMAVTRTIEAPWTTGSQLS